MSIVTGALILSLILNAILAITLHSEKQQWRKLEDEHHNLLHDTPARGPDGRFVKRLTHHD